MSRIWSLSPIAGALLVASLASPAHATGITLFDRTSCGSTTCTFAASDGPLSGAATFDYDTGTGVLTVLFTNLGAPSTGAGNVMTALFWEMPGDPMLTGVDGAAGLGPYTIFATPNGDLSQVSGGDNQLLSPPISSFGTPYIGGEWDFKGDISNPVVGLYGLGSTGLHLGFGGDFPDFFAPSGAEGCDPAFPNCSLSGSPSVNGPDYSLASEIGLYGGNEHTVLIVSDGPGGSSLQFQFNLDPADYAGIADVAFHYGSDAPIPEPGAGVLFASGALVVGLALRRKRAS